MRNLEFRLFIWLLKRYCSQIDQHDAIKFTVKGYNFYVSFGMQSDPPGYESAYREIK